MQKGHSHTENALFFIFLPGKIYALKVLHLFRWVVVFAVENALIVWICELDIDQLQNAFGEDEDEVRWNVAIRRFCHECVEATLKDAQYLSLFEVFFFDFPGFNLVNESYLRILVHCINFEQIRADSIMFLRPQLHHLQYIFRFSYRIFLLSCPLELAIVCLLVHKGLL